MYYNHVLFKVEYISIYVGNHQVVKVTSKTTEYLRRSCYIQIVVIQI